MSDEIPEAREAAMAELKDNADWIPGRERPNPYGFHVQKAMIAYAERVTADLRAELSEWRTLQIWGGTPEIIGAFIAGQQSRIHACQGIEAKLADAEREHADKLHINWQCLKALEAEKDAAIARAEAAEKSDRNQTELIESYENALREICLLFNVDPSEGEGTSGQEVFELVKRNVEAEKKTQQEADELLEGAINKGRKLEAERDELRREVKALKSPLELIDSAIAEELPHVSHVEYDSHEICKHFAEKVRQRIADAIDAARKESK